MRSNLFSAEVVRLVVCQDASVWRASIVGFCSSCEVLVHEAAVGPNTDLSSDTQHDMISHVLSNTRHIGERVGVDAYQYLRYSRRTFHGGDGRGRHPSRRCRLEPECMRIWSGGVNEQNMWSQSAQSRRRRQCHEHPQAARRVSACVSTESWTMFAVKC